MFTRALYNRNHYILQLITTSLLEKWHHKLFDMSCYQYIKITVYACV